MKAQSSPFKFLGFYVKESSISISSIQDEKAYDIEVSANGTFHKSTSRFELFLSLMVEGEDNSFKAKVSAIGNYEFTGELKDGDLGNFFYINSPAILFPYIRAYISALTSLSGIKPINLPTLNLSSLAQELKENITIID